MSIPGEAGFTLRTSIAAFILTEETTGATTATTQGAMPWVAWQPEAPKALNSALSLAADTTSISVIWASDRPVRFNSPTVKSMDLMRGTISHHYGFIPIRKNLS